MSEDSWFEEYNENEVPSGGRASRAWNTKEIKETVKKMLKKASSKTGKKVFGLPVSEAWKRWHGGEEIKYSSFYIRKKIMDTLDELHVENYKVYSVTKDGKKRVIVNLSDAEIPKKAIE